MTARVTLFATPDRTDRTHPHRDMEASFDGKSDACELVEPTLGAGLLYWDMVRVYTNQIRFPRQNRSRLRLLTPPEAALGAGLLTPPKYMTAALGAGLTTSHDPAQMLDR